MHSHFFNSIYKKLTAMRKSLDEPLDSKQIQHIIAELSTILQQILSIERSSYSEQFLFSWQRQTSCLFLLFLVKAHLTDKIDAIPMDVYKDPGNVLQELGKQIKVCEQSNSLNYYDKLKESHASLVETQRSVQSCTTP